MSFVLIKRIGYGSIFNELSICNNKIKKQSKTVYGDKKIKNEIEFYKYIYLHHLPFSIPIIYEYGINYYIMEYLENYKPLYQIFPDLSNLDKHNLLYKIYSELSILHQSTQYNVPKKVLYDLLLIETHSKLRERYLEIEPIVKKYSFITSVNGIPIISFDRALEMINNKINKYIDSLSSYSCCLIHGDCQFNNILYNTLLNKIYFIDPRGYFGNQSLFGIKEYDFAKIRFALSGYDIFDNMTVDSLDIQHSNITIPSLFLMDNIFKDDIITVLTLSIWLGNAHCFKNNILKAMYSYFYSLYLCTLHLQ